MHAGRGQQLAHPPLQMLRLRWVIGRGCGTSWRTTSRNVWHASRLSMPTIVTLADASSASIRVIWRTDHSSGMQRRLASVVTNVTCHWRRSRFCRVTGSCTVRCRAATPTNDVIGPAGVPHPARGFPRLAGALMGSSNPRKLTTITDLIPVSDPWTEKRCQRRTSGGARTDGDADNVNVKVAARHEVVSRGVQAPLSGSGTLYENDFPTFYTKRMENSVSKKLDVASNAKEDCFTDSEKLERASTSRLDQNRGRRQPEVATVLRTEYDWPTTCCRRRSDPGTVRIRTTGIGKTSGRRDIRERPCRWISCRLDRSLPSLLPRLPASSIVLHPACLVRVETLQEIATSLLLRHPTQNRPRPI